jgi:hypothetical protein
MAAMWLFCVLILFGLAQSDTANTDLPPLLREIISGCVGAGAGFLLTRRVLCGCFDAGAHRCIFEIFLGMTCGVPSYPPGALRPHRCTPGLSEILKRFWRGTFVGVLWNRLVLRIARKDIFLKQQNMRWECEANNARGVSSDLILDASRLRPVRQISDINSSRFPGCPSTAPDHFKSEGASVASRRSRESATRSPLELAGTVTCDR